MSPLNQTDRIRVDGFDKRPKVIVLGATDPLRIDLESEIP
jgi:hypothetical protein